MENYYYMFEPIVRKITSWKKVDGYDDFKISIEDIKQSFYGTIDECRPIIHNKAKQICSTYVFCNRNSIAFDSRADCEIIHLDSWSKQKEFCFHVNHSSNNRKSVCIIRYETWTTEDNCDDRTVFVFWLIPAYFIENIKMKYF